MGDRASYVVMDRGATAFFYYHWGAYSLPADLFWGSEAALRFIEALEPAEELLDDVWGEGAAVMDLTRKRLLLWCSGRESVAESPTLRQVYLAWLALSWAGWEVRWAHHGMPEIARYVDWPLDQVVSGGQRFLSLYAPPEAGWQVSDWQDLFGGDRTLLTVRWEGADQFHYLHPSITNHILAAGPGALSILRQMAPTELASDLHEQLWGTVFIDVVRRELHYWDGFESDHRLRSLVMECWPGWQVVEQHQGLYRHCILAGLPWREIIPAEAVIVDKLRGLLGVPGLRLDPGRALGAFASVIGPPSQVHPHFYQGPGPTPGSAERASHLEWIVQSWGARENAYETALATTAMPFKPL